MYCSFSLCYFQVPLSLFCYFLAPFAPFPASVPHLLTNSKFSMCKCSLFLSQQSLPISCSRSSSSSSSSVLLFVIHPHNSLIVRNACLALGSSLGFASLCTVPVSLSFSLTSHARLHRLIHIAVSFVRSLGMLSPSCLPPCLSHCASPSNCLRLLFVSLHDTQYLSRLVAAVGYPFISSLSISIGLSSYVLCSLKLPTRTPHLP